MNTVCKRPLLKCRRAFSLIEAAIVLGVVGLVIGGIWIAAAALMYKWEYEKFLQGFITQKVNVERFLTQSMPCATTGTIFAGTGGSFMKYDYPELFPSLYPAEWGAD